MDSHYNFNVKIYYTGKNKDGSNNNKYAYDGRPLTFYPGDLLSQGKMSIFDDKIPRAQDYHNIRLDFNSTDNSIMYIPDLDDYDISGMQRRRNPNTHLYINYYLPGYSIFLYENKIQPVPLSDDIYTVIVEQNNHKYYAYFRVVSKELKAQEWQIMVNDLEAISKEMATEYVHQYHHHLNLGTAEQPDILFLPLINNYRQIMNYIHLILLNPRYKISKRYNWVKLGQEKDIDQITIKKMNEVPNTNGSIYVPHRYINYDIEDNRWIKFIVKQLLERTNLAMKHYHTIEINITSSLQENGNHHFYHNGPSEITYYARHYEREESTLDKYVSKLTKLRGYLIYVLNNSLLSKIHRINGFIPKGLILSAKYNALYRLYINLKNNNLNEDTLTQQVKQYRYKPADELYEMWTVIQVIQALKYQDKYKGMKGWIFDEHLIMPSLKHGTKMIMKSTDDSNIYLVIIYNKALPRHRVSRNDKDFNDGIAPIYIDADHNKPDIRIDIFKNKNNFLGSIILDAKYMRLSHILTFHSNGSVRNQLFSYSRLPSTNPKLPWAQIPVDRVYALYPSNDDKYYSQNYKMCDDMGVSLTRLRPGNKDDTINFARDINKRIDTTIDKANRSKNYRKLLKRVEDDNK